MWLDSCPKCFFYRRWTRVSFFLTTPSICSLAPIPMLLKDLFRYERCFPVPHATSRRPLPADSRRSLAMVLFFEASSR